MHSMPHGGELFAQARLAEARDADDALVRRGALGQPRQRRADLAADAEDDEVAATARENSAPSSGVGVVITSSRCSTSRKCVGQGDHDIRHVAMRMRASISDRRILEGSCGHQ